MEKNLQHSGLKRSFGKSISSKVMTLVGMCLLVGSVNVQAAPIVLGPGLAPVLPDIMVSTLNMSFDGRNFIAKNSLSSVFVAAVKQSSNIAIANGSYSLTGSVNNLGILAPGAALDIRGDVGGVTYAIHRSVTQYGFGGTGTAADPFFLEFLSKADKGSPSFKFGSLGGTFIKVSNVINNKGFFTANGDSDNFNIAAVPEPGSILLLLLGGLVMVGFTRRRFTSL